MREKAVLLQQGTSLIGVLSEPAPSEARGDVPAIIILNAGVIHRVGPNRLYVKIARDLASVGFSVLRFDFSGIGDSPLRSDNVPFDISSEEETQRAMDYLTATKQAQRFVLLGICSGANAAFRAACRDDRVTGIVGINGTYLNNDETQKMRQRIQHRVHGRYYRKHLLDGRKWWRVITGKSDIRSIMKFVVRKCKEPRRCPDRVPSQTHASLQWNALARREVHSLLVYSEGSSALDAFSLAIEPSLRTVAPERLTVEVIQDSDHVFTLLWSQRVLIALIRTWMLSTNRSWRSVNPEKQPRVPV